MTIHIVVIDQEGSKYAVAAFSSREKADDHLASADWPQIRFDFFEIEEPPRSKGDVPLSFFAAQRVRTGGGYELGGYFLAEFEAADAAGEGGYTHQLVVDVPPDEPQLGPPDPEDDEDWPDLEELAAKREAARKMAAAKAGAQPKESAGRLPRHAPTVPRFDGSLIAVIALALLAVGFVVAGLYFSTNHYNYARNVQSVDWLPGQAANISYFFADELRAFEFDIAEAGFIQWVEEQNLDRAPVNGETVEITRCLAYFPDPISDLEGMTEEEEMAEWMRIRRASTNDGWEVRGDMDSYSYHGIYDRELGRAYLHGTAEEEE